VAAVVCEVMADGAVAELRLVLRVDDLEHALGFYRDALGLPLREQWSSEAGTGVVLDAGRATVELLSAGEARRVDEIEAGGQAAGPLRLALEVGDSAAAAAALVTAGAEQVAEPVVTPWGHRNVRLRAPDGMQLTLFTVLDEDTS
jgi:catechol 2,3-dioxygenase-like lactoylglutathione lyase family enzyme